MKKKVRSKVGASGTFVRAAISSDVRSYVVDDSGKRWRWVVDNRMRDYGDIDFERRVIRINHHLRHDQGSAADFEPALSRVVVLPHPPAVAFGSCGLLVGKVRSATPKP